MGVAVAMMMTKTINKISRVEQILDFTLGSSDASEVCKRFVHGSYSWGTVQGAFLYHLDNRSNLIQIAGYGMPYIEDVAIFSIWEASLPAMSDREKSMVSESTKVRKVAALPTMLDGLPNGCLVLVLSPDSEVEQNGKELGPFLSKLGGYFLESQMSQANSAMAARDAAGARTLVTTGSPDDLTTRQVQILGLMADGLTNADIATRVLLSESTVRQETIRIYRALRVGSRIEATAKGRAIGLIPKIALENAVNKK